MVDDGRQKKRVRGRSTMGRRMVERTINPFTFFSLPLPPKRRVSRRTTCLSLCHQWRTPLLPFSRSFCTKNSYALPLFRASKGCVKHLHSSVSFQLPFSSSYNILCPFYPLLWILDTRLFQSAEKHWRALWGSQLEGMLTTRASSLHPSVVLHSLCVFYSN